MRISERSVRKEIDPTSCDGSEAFLTGRVPNLQFDSFPIQVDGSYFEINARKDGDSVSVYDEEIIL